MAIRALAQSEVKTQKIIRVRGAAPERRHSQVVRQRSAKPLSPGSNPGVALVYYLDNYPKPRIYVVSQGLLIIVNVLQCTRMYLNVLRKLGKF